MAFWQRGDGEEGRWDNGTMGQWDDNFGAPWVVVGSCG